MAKKNCTAALTLADMLYSQGFGTRYDCASIAASGAISIAGVVHDDPDEMLDLEGLVFRWRGVDWPYCEKAVIALNKPAGYECSMKPSAYPSVLNLLPGPLRARNVQPVGRLDADTTGLLILTDDGALQHRLIHPKRHVEKVYEVALKHDADPGMCAKLLAGVVLDDDPKPVAAAAAGIDPDDPKHLTMTLVQGKYHQVKRMVAACGNRVEAQHRSRFGANALPDDMKPGEWRWLAGPQTVLGGKQ